jgi:hypothetical protein
MRHLLVVERRLKLLGDDATEHVQGSLPIRFGKNFPKPRQGYLRVGSRCRRKKIPSWLWSIALLLEQNIDRPNANRPASTKQKPILPHC